MRLIDADALIDDLMERYCKECDKRKGVKNGKWQIIYEIGEAPCRACEVDDVKAELEEAPTADVPDRKVGKWIDEPVYRQTMDGKTWDGYTYCSECREMHEYGYRSNYCPNCGADTRGAEQ